MGKEVDQHWPTALHHPKDRGPFLVHGAPATFALESAAPPCSALALDHLGLSFMAGDHIRFIALDLVGQRHSRLFFMIPARSWAVICCTSLPCSASSWASCSLDIFKPMK